jgi:predicted N-acyltransferase
MPSSPSPDQPRLEISVLPSYREVEAAAWDRLVPPDDPFCTHAFLSALVDSGSATAETGWMPAPVVVREPDGGRLVAAAPAWLKMHSYGEYIFDWGWAKASERAGIPYYPKVLVAVPFTPATGRRLLIEPGGDPKVLEPALVAGLHHLREAGHASGVHLLFLTEGEHARFADHAPRFLRRVTHQFHWTNDGYDSFEHWVSTFRSKVRKETRRERRKPEQLGATVHVLRGDQITAAQWGALEGFYRSTCDKKWGEAYLHPDFFELAPLRLSSMAVALLAEVDGRYVAGALAFQRGRHLYGRYWGCEPGFEPLHFELCYHRPIELCIDEGWTRFEAGAQGNHKLKRGLMPHETLSVHWMAHGGLHDAVARAVAEETAETRAHLAAIAHHGPFRRDES